MTEGELHSLGYRHTENLHPHFNSLVKGKSFSTFVKRNYSRAAPNHNLTFNKELCLFKKTKTIC